MPESIPEPGTSLLIAGYPVEIVQAASNGVKTVRVKPDMRRPVEADARRRRNLDLPLRFTAL